MVKLYHAPISQVDRAWRKTVDGLEKDETCQFNIVAKLYSPSNNSFIWIIERDISTATYFVRAHAYNSADEEIAFGQSINFRPYAPIIQVDRAQRKIVDSLEMDKICQFKIVPKPYSPSNNSFTWTMPRHIPTATCFVNVYAYNSANEEVAFGQSTDAHKIINLFEIQAISGLHTSIDIATTYFSAFSIVSLFGFFYLEK
ncbi:hypothetical protein M9H77_24422 [Catharanthus roseus]|uniref:Uncharacterized protein n=1 Tax=Catharanthus roseus TaxID=4058 RepID=A0ACC0AY87_CATRO|nr:hypothetical protein M9H77_24422 [Catharanthus roseus]